MRVLETACGTGILTERLLRRLAGQGVLVATDLNEPMIAYARQKGVGEAGPEWGPAEAEHPPAVGGSIHPLLFRLRRGVFPAYAAVARHALWGADDGRRCR